MRYTANYIDLLLYKNPGEEILIGSLKITGVEIEIKFQYIGKIKDFYRYRSVESNFMILDQNECRFTLNPKHCHSDSKLTFIDKVSELTYICLLTYFPVDELINKTILTGDGKFTLANGERHHYWEAFFFLRQIPLLKSAQKRQ